MKHHSGLTFIDLLITLSIVLILVGVAIPSFHSLILNTRASMTINTLLHQLNFARQNAVTVRVPTVLCPSENQERCVNNWENDWIIFEDDNDNQQRDDEERLLRQSSGLSPTQGSLHWISFQSRPYIRFDYKGSTGYQNGHLYYCDKNEEIKRQLIVYRSGRIRKSQEHELRDRCR